MTIPEFHQHPDGNIYVRTDDGVYIENPDNFETDFGQPLPVLAEGVTERIYVPGVRHPIMKGGDVVDGGPMPWPLGDQIIAHVLDLIAAKATREAPPPKTLDQLKADKTRELQGQCTLAILSGFTSSALGTPHLYPAGDRDQFNLLASVMDAALPHPSGWTTPIMCQDTTTGEWGLMQHTAAQAVQAGEEGKAAVVMWRTHYAGLLAQVTAATDQAELDAITW